MNLDEILELLKIAKERQTKGLLVAEETIAETIIVIEKVIAKNDKMKCMGGDNQMNKSRIGKLTKNQRRILRCRAFIMVQNSKARRRYKFSIAFCDLMIHITKVNEAQGNRGVTVTGGFGFDANGNPRTIRLS